MKSRVVYLLLTLLLTGWMVGASAQNYQEGKDYLKLGQPVPTTTGDKVEVVEVFWYGCPHCYALEPEIEKWLENKPEAAEFVRIPGVLNPRWELDARVFYALKALEKENELHRTYMDAIHEQGRQMGSPERIADFMAEQGVDRQKFLNAMKSFTTETQLRQSQQKTRLYRLRGVPALVVNGKYVVSGSTAGTAERMFDIIDYLVEQEKQG